MLITGLSLGANQMLQIINNDYNDIFETLGHSYLEEKTNFKLLRISGIKHSKDDKMDNYHPVSYTHLTLPTTPYV